MSIRPASQTARAAVGGRSGEAPGATLDTAGDPVLKAWRTNARVTSYFVEAVPQAIWSAVIPGMRKTVREQCAHLHTSRRSWLRVKGAPLGVAVPDAVDRRRVTRKQLLAALKRSGTAMEQLLARGIAAGGAIPPTKAYVWRNLPLDVSHVLTYFSSHEAHHRGQLLLIARQLGHPIDVRVRNGVWHFVQRSAEAERGVRG